MAEERSSWSYDLSFQFSSIDSSSTNTIELRPHACILTAWCPHSYTRSLPQNAVHRFSIAIISSSTTHSILYSSRLKECPPQAYTRNGTSNGAHCTSIINASSSLNYSHSTTIIRHCIHNRINTDVILHRFTRNENWDSEQILAIHFTLCTMSTSSQNARSVRKATHLHELQLHSFRTTTLRYHATVFHRRCCKGRNRGHV